MYASVWFPGEVAGHDRLIGNISVVYGRSAGLTGPGVEESNFRCLVLTGFGAYKLT